MSKNHSRTVSIDTPNHSSRGRTPEALYWQARFGGSKDFFFENGRTVPLRA